MEACRDELSVAETDIGADDHAIFLAMIDESIAGFYDLKSMAADRMEMQALFVEPASIGRGVGRRLMAHACEEARRRGATSIFIQSDPNAERFYRAAGAVKIGERPSGSIAGRMLPEYRIDLS